jgi:hypothetical protein
VVQTHARYRLAQARSITSLTTPKRPANLLGECLVVAEFLYEWFMEEILNIFGVVEGGRGCGAFGCLLLVARLTRIDTWVNC